jgi:hypothetical protein
MNPYDSPESGRPGMSGTTKVLLVLGICFLVLVVVCCGGFAALTYWGISLAKRATITEPAEIRRVTEEIVTISIPDSFKPERAMDFPIPFNEGSVKAAIYDDTAADGKLLLSQIDTPLANNPGAGPQLQGSMFNREETFGHKTIVVKESEKFETEINGESATFNIGQGVAQDSDDEFWQVTCEFHGKTGPAKFELRIKSADFSKEQVMELLRSMK